MGTAFVIARAITYSTLFIGLLLIFVPARVLTWAGIARPPGFGIFQFAGVFLGGIGACLALWCIASFVVLGRGTPAPFDPPRRLVVRGPYRFLRNPMYAGATLSLAGAALFYQSWALLAYGSVFWLTTHVFVVAYEEPTLRDTFRTEYEGYCARVGRWWPSLGRRRDG